MGRPPLPRGTTSAHFSNEPSPEALAFFRNKASLPSFDYRDVWAEEHAYSFTVAKAMRLEVLETIRRSVDQALANGVPFEQFARELTPRLQRLGWWGSQFVVDPETGEEIIATLGTPQRLRLIYDANIRSAHAAGQWERAQRTKFALPYFLYLQTTSAAPRDDHLAQVGTVAHVDDPYWDTWFPPNGWNCKCQVRQVSQLEADRLGHRPPPPVVTRPWLNKRTGEVEEIPVGIDPGWHRNPGKLRHATLDELLSGTLDNVDPALRAAALKDLPNSWLFRKIIAREVDSTPGKPGFFQLPKTADVAAPIGHLERDLAAAHGGRSGVIWLSGERLMIRDWQHVTKQQWAVAPRVFDEGAVIRSESNEGWLVFYRTIGGKTYRAEVALRDALVDGTPYKGGARLNLESYQIVDRELARVDIELARAEGRLVRAEAKPTANLFSARPASLGAAATPKGGGGEPPRTADLPAAKLPSDSFDRLPAEEVAKQLDAYKGLSTLDRELVAQYTRYDYAQINHYLRNGDLLELISNERWVPARPEKWERLRTRIEGLSKRVQEAVYSNVLPEGTALYRGQFVFDERMLTEGFEWTDDAFVSTTHGLKEAFSFYDANPKKKNVVLVIDAGNKRGLAVEKFAEWGYEKEVVLPAGTSFRVRRVEKAVKRGLLDRARTYVHVEIVDQPSMRSGRGRSSQSRACRKRRAASYCGKE